MPPDPRSPREPTAEPQGANNILPGREKRGPGKGCAVNLASLPGDLFIPTSQIVKRTKQSTPGRVSLKVWLRINSKCPSQKLLGAILGLCHRFAVRWTSAPGACCVVTSPVWDSWFCEPGSSSPEPWFLLQTALFAFFFFLVIVSNSRTHTLLQLS